MAKRKAKVEPKSQPTAEAIEDLLVLAQELGVPEGALDEELEDVCESAKRRQLAAIKDGLLWTQLEFLVANGFSLKRLEELIRELAKSPDSNTGH